MGFVRARDEEVEPLTIPNLAIPLISPDVRKFMCADAGGGQNDDIAPVTQFEKRAVQSTQPKIPTSGSSGAWPFYNFGYSSYWIPVDSPPTHLGVPTGRRLG